MGLAQVSPSAKRLLITARLQRSFKQTQSRNLLVFTSGKRSARSVRGRNSVAVFATNQTAKEEKEAAEFKQVLPTTLRLSRKSHCLIGISLEFNLRRPLLALFSLCAIARVQVLKAGSGPCCSFLRASGCRQTKAYLDLPPFRRFG